MRTPGFTAAIGLLLTLASPTTALAKPAAKPKHPASLRCPTAETVDPQALPAEHYRRARCDELEGLLVTALDHYELALRQQPPTLLARQLQARIGALVPRLGTLRVDASAWPAADTRVRIGSRVVETGGARRPYVDPGRVEIIVEAPGFEPARLTVDVAVGEEKALTLPAPRPRTPAAADPATTNAPTPRLAVATSAAVYGPAPGDGVARPIGYSGLAVGGAALVAGAVAGILALDHAAVVRADCPTPSTCSARGAAAARAGASFSTASTVLFTSGAVVGLGGLALVLLGAPKPRTVAIADFVLMGGS